MTVAPKPIVSKDLEHKNAGVLQEPTPFLVRIDIQGTAPLMVHRYDMESVAAKGKAPKGSTQKKTDDVESYVYRLPNGDCGIPGEMFKACLAASAKFEKDPRSPRKSAYDLFRAGIVCDTFASLGKKSWDYLDKRPVVVQMSRVPRERPAFNKGWKLAFDVEVLLPEYITFELLSSVVTRAGRVCGLGDFRPDFGRFMVTRFEQLKL